MGGIPIAISQFAELSGAVACVVPDPARDFDYSKMVERICQGTPTMKHGIVLGDASHGFLSLSEMVAKPSALPASALSDIKIDPTDPAVKMISAKMALQTK